MNSDISHTPQPESQTEAIKTLLPKLVETAPTEAVAVLVLYSDEFVVQMLELLNPASAQNVIERFTSERRQWMRNVEHGDQTIGHMMEPPLAVYRAHTTTADLGQLAKRALITYV